VAAAKKVVERTRTATPSGGVAVAPFSISATPIAIGRSLAQRAETLGRKSTEKAMELTVEL
jgi:hypothetical protein